MLWCDTGASGAEAFDDLSVFVNQLNANGIPAAIDVRSAPEELGRSVHFDIAPWLRQGPMASGDRALVLAAQSLSDGKLGAIRRLAVGSGSDCLAFGVFETRQARIGLQAKLSYALGHEPRVIDLMQRDYGGPSCRGAPVLGVSRRSSGAARPRLLIVGAALQDAREAAAVIALALSRELEIALLTDGKTKDAWKAAHGHALAVYHFGEVPPAVLMDRVDILACFAPFQNTYRVQSLVANVAVSGGVLLDCTAGHLMAAENDAFIPAPIDLMGLGPFIISEITPNLAPVRTHVQASAFVSRIRAAAAATLPQMAADTPGAPPGKVPEIFFMPTNGVGLGHAQRCRLVASEMPSGRARAAFAVFPSCMGLVKAYGFDAMPLVQRSLQHARSHENDLVNYLRLRSLTVRSRTLVFDGGYIFDSVFRTILENRLQGIWIRRGLWKATQDNSIALDREKVFARVIVPDEAFDELNVVYSRGSHLRAVGPIVQRTDLGAEDCAALRAKLARRYDLPFERLVVSQLGAGVAANRNAQVQAVCAMMERRRDVLHLVVTWPTATVHPGWLGWGRSRVVRTHHAGVLAAAADLCISAAGYNSFHEALYGARPTIFLPQVGAFMDDQLARCRSAREREVAGLVEAHELMKLEREVSRFLDAGGAEALRSRLATLELPEPGNRAAADLIEEMTDGPGELAGALCEDRSAGRGRS